LLRFESKASVAGGFRVRDHIGLDVLAEG